MRLAALMSKSFLDRTDAVARGTRLRLALAWLSVLGLNCLVFAPSFVFSQPHARAFAVLGNPALRNPYQALLGLVLRRPNLDVFRVSFDLGLLLMAASWAARFGCARAAVRAAVGLYVWLLLFLGYDQAVRYFYARPPALGEDWRLALNLTHFIEDMFSLRVGLLLAAGFAGLLLVIRVAAFAIRTLQERSLSWSRARLVWICSGFIAVATASFAYFGIDSDQPVMQWASKRMLYNIRASRAEMLSMAPLRDGSVDDRYDEFNKVVLQTKPNFYLFMIEAYGEILATWDMTDAYRALLERVQTRLEAAGYHACSTYSAAPVYGGTSWFSIATVQTGIMIDRPVPYSAFELSAPRVPSLTRFLKAQGYHTYALQPGNKQRAGLRRVDLYQHDVNLDGDGFDYHGPNYGWGHIPDQFALGHFRERVRANVPEPRYVFFMSVSTHYPWGSEVPPYVRDWKSLNDRGPEEASDPRWPALPHTQAIGTALRSSYLRSIEYEWRNLLDVLETEPAREIVVIVLGDHQPRLEANRPGDVTLNAPLHILSRDPTFIARFRDQGFQPGLYARPGITPPLQHEGLFSLWVSQLAAAYGKPGANAASYYPDGIGLAGLNR